MPPNAPGAAPDWISAATADLPALLLPDAAAKFLSVSVRTLGRWAAAGRLRVVRLTPGPGSGGVRIPKSELERLLIDGSSVSLASE